MNINGNHTASSAVRPIKLHGKWGAIDSCGMVVIPNVYDYLTEFQFGCAIGLRGKNYGTVSRDGSFRGSCYRLTKIVGNGLLSFKETSDGLEGLVSFDGRIISPLKYQRINQAQEGLIIVKQGGMWGAIDENGDPKIEPTHAGLDDFSGGLAAAMNHSGRYGYVDRSNKTAIEFLYGRTHSFSENLATVEDWDTGLSGFVDTAGRLVIPPVFDSAKRFSEGVAPASLERGNLGFINKSGEWMIEPKFKACSPFLEGLAGVAIDWDEQKCGFIDKQGVWKVPPLYNHLDHFKNGICFVQGADAASNEPFSAYIDTAGRLIWGPGDSWW